MMYNKLLLLAPLLTLDQRRDTMADGQKTAAQRALDSLKGTAPKTDKHAAQEPKTLPANHWTDVARAHTQRIDR